MTPACRQRAIGTILIVALSGFLMGFDGSLFTGAVGFIESEFALNAFELGWAVTSMAVAATVSIFISGPLADRFGRRTVLRLATCVFAASALLAALSENFATLIVARLLSGFGVGAVLITAPMYIAEISPSAWRGRMVSFNQLFIVLGSAGRVRQQLLHRAFRRRRGLELALDAGHRRGARDSVFLRVVGGAGKPALAGDARPVAGRAPRARRASPASSAPTASSKRCSSRSSTRRARAKPALVEILDPALRGVLVIGLLVGILQQITGISSVLSYAVVIFERAGAGANASFMQTVFVGLVNVVFTVLALLLIDRVGRRPLADVRLLRHRRIHAAGVVRLPGRTTKHGARCWC